MRLCLAFPQIVLETVEQCESKGGESWIEVEVDLVVVVVGRLVFCPGDPPGSKGRGGMMPRRLERRSSSIAAGVSEVRSLHQQPRHSQPRWDELR